jgi:hypothetical protein
MATLSELSKKYGLESQKPKLSVVADKYGLLSEKQKKELNWQATSEAPEVGPPSSLAGPASLSDIARQSLSTMGLTLGAGSEQAALRAIPAAVDQANEPIVPNLIDPLAAPRSLIERGLGALFPEQVEELRTTADERLNDAIPGIVASEQQMSNLQKSRGNDFLGETVGDLAGTATSALPLAGAAVTGLVTRSPAAAATAARMLAPIPAIQAKAQAMLEAKRAGMTDAEAEDYSNRVTAIEYATEALVPGAGKTVAGTITKRVLGEQLSEQAATAGETLTQIATAPELAPKSVEESLERQRRTIAPALLFSSVTAPIGAKAVTEGPVKLPDTGVPAFDAGKEAAAAMLNQAASGDVSKGETAPTEIKLPEAVALPPPAATIKPRYRAKADGAGFELIPAEVEQPSTVAAPSEVAPTVNQPVESIQEPITQIEQPEVNQPVEAVTSPSINSASIQAEAPKTPEVDLGALLRERNERSMKETGAPLKPEEVDTIVRSQAAKAEGVPAASIATSPMDYMRTEALDEAISPERAKAINESIRTRMKEDTGIRKVLDQELAKGPGQGSIRAVLNSVITADSSNTYQRALASRLSDVAESLGISIVGAEIDPVTGEATRTPKASNLGAYSAIDNAIRITTANPETVIHEVVHGISKGILNDTELQAKNPQIKLAVNDMKSMLSEVQFDMQSKPTLLASYPKLQSDLLKHGTLNIDEFFTMSMTNPELQTYLASIPSKADPKKSVWQSIKDILKRLLGLGRVEGTLLDRALDRGFEVVDFASANPKETKIATKRQGERIKERIIQERRDETRYLEAEELKKSDPKAALRKILGLDNQELETAKPTTEASPKKRKVPVNRGKVVEGAKRILSAQAGRMFGKDFDKSRNEILAGKEAGQRVYMNFAKAGYNKLSKENKKRVDLAVDGKADISDLSPKMQAAVKDYRNRVMTEQLRLAFQTNDEKTKKMLYDSIARGDWSTRAFAAFDLKPDSIDTVLYFMHQAQGGDKPYWLWKQERNSPELVAGLKSVFEGIVIPDVDTLSDKEKGKLASFYELKGTEEEIDAALRKERARLGGDEESQVYNLIRELSDPLGKDQDMVRVEKKAALDLTILKHRKDVPKALREFWGEFTEAPLKGAMTIARITKLTAQQKMLNSIATDGRGSYLFAPGEKTPKGFTKALPNSEALGSLAGMVTRPDIAAQLETLVKASSSETMGDWEEAVKATWALLGKVIGPTKVVKTVWNVPTAIANIVSATSMLPNFYMRGAAMGMPIQSLGDTMVAFRDAVMDAAGRLDEGRAVKLLSAGLSREGVQIGELNEMIQHFEWDAQNKNSSKAAQLPRRLIRGVQNAAGGFSTFYQIPDNVLRLQAAAIEFAIQKKLNPNITPDAAFEIAADRAKNMVPTWSRASPLVRKIGTALGNFPTFISEVFRTTAWQLAYGYNDLVMGIKTGNKQLAYYGAVQLAGTAMQFKLMSAFVPMAMAAAFGFDDEEGEEKTKALEEIVPDYHRGNSVQTMHVDPKTLKTIYTNTDRMDFLGPINTLLGRIALADDFNESMGEGFGWASDVLGVGPGLKAWSAALTGRDEYDRALSDEERVSTLMGAYEPGTVGWFQRADDMERRGVDARVVKAARMGLPVYEVDTKATMKSAAFDFKSKIADADAILRRNFGKYKYSGKALDVATPEEQKELFVNYLVAERQAFTDLSDKIQAAKTLYGDTVTTRSKLFDILKETKVSPKYRQNILEGKFESKMLSEDFLKGEMEDAIRKDPSKKAEIQKDFRERTKALREFRRDFKELLNEQEGED